MTTDNWNQIETKSKQALPDAIVEYIAECRRDEHPESYLIAILHKVQSHFGFLGTEQMDAVAQLLQVPTTKVSGVATFYHFFRLKPRGQFMVSVCLGTACYVKGAEAILERIKQELGVDLGETTKDGIFTLQASRCLGTCGLAPVVMIDDEVHGKLKPDHIPVLLQKYREKAAGAVR